MTRIRYKNVNNNLVSDEFLAVNDLVKVTILTNILEVHISNIKGEFLLQSIKQSSLQNAKKLAKKTLIELGVNFQPEVRPRLTTSLIKDNLGTNASLTYKQDLFED